MYAMIGTVEIAAGRADEAAALLRDSVVPQVQQLPGFVSGTWARSSDGARGHSMLLFETEEAAKEAANRASQGPPGDAPVRFVSAAVCEVLAQA